MAKEFSKKQVEEWKRQVKEQRELLFKSRVRKVRIEQPIREPDSNDRLRALCDFLDDVFE